MPATTITLTAAVPKIVYLVAAVSSLNSLTATIQQTVRIYGS